MILARHPEGVLLVHGAAPAEPDAIATAYASRTSGYRIEAHPADWSCHGRAAGQLRNAAMIGLGADGCAAFLRGASPGTTATVQLAKAAGIPVWLQSLARLSAPPLWSPGGRRLAEGAVVLRGRGEYPVGNLRELQIGEIAVTLTLPPDT